MITKYFLFENKEFLNSVKFIYEEDEDKMKIKAFYKGKKIGIVILEIFVNSYWEFEDDFNEDEYNDMFPDDEYVKISWFDVTPEYRKSGLARKLMLMSIDKVKERGYHQIYLNASPIGSDGLAVKDLVWYYKVFGFKEILNQGHNVQMLLNI